MRPAARRSGIEIPHGAGESAGARLQGAWRHTDTCSMMRCTSQECTHPCDGALPCHHESNSSPDLLNVAPEEGGLHFLAPAARRAGRDTLGDGLVPGRCGRGHNIGQVMACLYLRVELLRRRRTDAREVWRQPSIGTRGRRVDVNSVAGRSG